VVAVKEHDFVAFVYYFVASFVADLRFVRRHRMQTQLVAHVSRLLLVRSQYFSYAIHHLERPHFVVSGKKLRNLILNIQKLKNFD